MSILDNGPRAFDCSIYMVMLGVIGDTHATFGGEIMMDSGSNRLL